MLIATDLTLNSSLLSSVLSVFNVSLGRKTKYALIGDTDNRKRGKGVIETWQPPTCRASICISGSDSPRRRIGLIVSRTMSSYPSAFALHDDPVKALFGPSPKLELLLENGEYPFAHEAGVFIDRDDTLFITSNVYPDPATGKKKIQISKVTIERSGDKVVAKAEEIHPGRVHMANGGVNYQDGLILCAQGGPDHASEPAGIVSMTAEAPYTTRVLVSDFHGRAFNSVNDVVVHSDGSIWFTDPIYGFEQGFRQPPQLPCQVYRFDPSRGIGGRGSIRAVADGFGRPNGICFGPDEKIVYVTDTDWIHGDGTKDLSRASTM